MYCSWIHAFNLSVWMKEICTLLVKLYIICSGIQRVNLHARPHIIQVVCSTCCFQVCALDHAKGWGWGGGGCGCGCVCGWVGGWVGGGGGGGGCTADLVYRSEPCHRNKPCLDYLPVYFTGEFQALELIFLVVFGARINHLPTVFWSTFWKSSLKS